MSLTVRVDRPGVLLRDLHTVGGGLPANATVTTAEGKKRTGDTGTLLTHRTYLADAAFTAAVAFGRDDTDLLAAAPRPCVPRTGHPSSVAAPARPKAPSSSARATTPSTI